MKSKTVGRTKRAATKSDNRKSKLERRAIFISHKSMDIDAAERICEKLKCFGADKVQTFASSIKAGDEFHKVILGALKRCDILLFLYTDPEIRYDWCIYETGFFDGLREAQFRNKRLIVLHRTGVKVPSPLNRFESVELDGAENKPLRRLISLIFKGINDTLSRQEAPAELISTFLQAFPKGQEQTIRFTKQLKITVPHESIGSIVDGQVPAHARVRGSLTIFSYANDDQEVEWKDFINNLAEKGRNTPNPGSATGWAKHLGKVLRFALNRLTMSLQALPLYYSIESDESVRTGYRPAVWKMTTHADGSVEFEIGFTTLPRELSARAPGDLGVLSHLLEVARYYRFGIMTNPDFACLFEDDDRVIDDREKLETLGRFDIVMTSLRVDFENRGLGSQDVEKAFGPDGSPERLEAERRRAQLAGYRLQLGQSLDQGDWNGVRKVLRIYNEEFVQWMQYGVKRYTQLMGKFLDSEAQRLALMRAASHQSAQLTSGPVSAAGRIDDLASGAAQLAMLQTARPASPPPSS